MTDERKGSGRDASQGFLYFALGAALAMGLGTFGLAFFAENVVSFAVATLIGLVAAVVVCLLLLVFRDSILQSIAGRAETNLSALAKPARAVTEHLMKGQPQAAADHVETLLEVGLARYALLLQRRWMVWVVLGLLGTYATLAGSALIFQQNQLVSNQTALITIAQAREEIAALDEAQNFIGVLIESVEPISHVSNVFGAVLNIDSDGKINVICEINGTCDDGTDYFQPLFRPQAPVTIQYPSQISHLRTPGLHHYLLLNLLVSNYGFRHEELQRAGRLNVDAGGYRAHLNRYRFTCDADAKLRDQIIEQLVRLRTAEATPPFLTAPPTGGPDIIPTYRVSPSIHDFSGATYQVLRTNHPAPDGLTPAQQIEVVAGVYISVHSSLTDFMDKCDTVRSEWENALDRAQVSLRDTL